MKQVPVIKFKNVSKTFTINSPDKLKQALSLRSKPETQTITALKDVSFVINKHQTVGFYGPNGSGKTVILRLIAGILYPDSGSISVKQKVTPIIEFGTGLHPDLSGLDNIYLYSALIGVPKPTIDKNLLSIIQFAELNQFINLPVKKYSSGMKAKLSFSIAIHSHSQILLIDEVLAVGDQAFQRKCIDKINHLKSRTTIILVSHNLHLIKQLCHKVFFMTKINQALTVPAHISLLLDLPVGAQFTTQTDSESMSPIITTKNKLVVRKVKFDQLKKTDIIMFFQESLNILVVHRIKKIHHSVSHYSFVTQGDANPLPDPTALSKKDYIGKVVKII